MIPFGGIGVGVVIISRYFTNRLISTKPNKLGIVCSEIVGPSLMARQTGLVVNMSADIYYPIISQYPIIYKESGLKKPDLIGVFFPLFIRENSKRFSDIISIGKSFS